jgi:hypothetical protein
VPKLKLGPARNVTTKPFLETLGRVLLGVPMFIFGIQHFMYVDFVITGCRRGVT